MSRVILPRRAFLTAGAGLIVTTGCSEEQDCAFEDTVVAGRDANPDGVAYPEGPYGAEPGELYPNHTFHGYVDSDTSRLSLVSMADFLDPERKRHRLLHLMAAAMWCPVCSGQTDEMALFVPELEPEGLVVVQALIDGPSRGTPPDRCDMESWIERRGTTFTVVFDASGQRTAFVARYRGVPWNALVDTSTMRVVAAVEGRPSDYAAFVRSGLDAVA